MISMHPNLYLNYQPLEKAEINNLAYLKSIIFQIKIILYLFFSQANH